MAARTRSRFDEPASKPASDAYTGLLALSLIAMIASCVILYLDYAQYGNTKAPAPNVPAPPAKNPAIDQRSTVTRMPMPTKDLVQAPAPITPAVATEPAPAPVMPAPTEPSLLPPAVEDAPLLPVPVVPQN